MHIRLCVCKLSVTTSLLDRDIDFEGDVQDGFEGNSGHDWEGDGSNGQGEGDRKHVRGWPVWRRSGQR